MRLALQWLAGYDISKWIHFYDGTLIYTKGTIVRQEEREVFYVLVSAKIATLGE